MLDRTVQPPFQTSSSFDLIQPETITLKNGVPITVIRGGGQSVAKIEFVFDAGKWYEQHAGVSYFTAHLLQKGIASKNSYQISAETEQLGVHFEVSPGHDFTSLSLYGLTKNINQVFPLTHEILSAPTFPQHELDQSKAIYNQGLRINLEKTSYLASRYLRKNLFGPNHPYGTDAALEDISALDRNWLVDFHSQHFKGFRIIASGNVTDILIKELSGIFENLTLQQSAFKRIIDSEQLSVSHEYVEKKDSVQSSLRMGRKVIGRLHADYPALLLLNHIFGGYFGSRLMKNIREEKGLTYGIYSSVTALKHDSYLTVGTDVNKENRELALQEIKNEMMALCQHTIGANELEAARNHFIGSLQAEITTPFAHADKIKNLLLFELPKDYYQQLIYKTDSLTAQDLLRAANEYLNPETFSTVAVG